MPLASFSTVGANQRLTWPINGVGTTLTADYSPSSWASLVRRAKGVAVEMGATRQTAATTVTGLTGGDSTAVQRTLSDLRARGAASTVASSTAQAAYGASSEGMVSGWVRSASGMARSIRVLPAMSVLWPAFAAVTLAPAVFSIGVHIGNVIDELLGLPQWGSAPSATYCTVPSSCNEHIRAATAGQNQSIWCTTSAAGCTGPAPAGTVAVYEWDSGGGYFGGVFDVGQGVCQYDPAPDPTAYPWVVTNGYVPRCLPAPYGTGKLYTLDGDSMPSERAPQAGLCTGTCATVTAPAAVTKASVDAYTPTQKDAPLIQAVANNSPDVTPVAGTAPADPVTITVFAPTTGETYADYIARLQVVGLVGQVSFLSDSASDPTLGPLMVVRTNPRAGAHVGLGTTVVVIANPATAPDGGTAGAPELVTDPGTGPTAPGVSFAPLTDLPLGDKFPFAVPAWVAGALGGLGGGDSCPGTGHVPGGAVYGSRIPISWCVLQPMIDVIRPVFLFASLLGLAWLFAGAAMGFGGGAATEEE